MPLAFEPNRGQADPAVRFLARGRGYAVFFTDAEAVLVLTPTQPATGRRGTPAEAPSTPAVVRMRLVGASPAPAINGLEPLPGRSHYLVGARSRWQRDVPTFGRLRYENVYPGVNLVFYGTERELEYDLLVAPGTDPDAVALAFEGADGLRVDEGGDLVIATAAGELRLRRPVIYEEGEDARRKLEGGYVVDGGRVRFQVAGRDARRALVIDPVLGYSSFLGGSSTDQGFGIAVDTAGNAYVTGTTTSANFPVSVTAVQPGRTALTDAFVTKLDAAGAVVYSTYLGGTGDEAGHAITVDAAGNAYVTGTTTSNDFPTVGPFQATLRGGQDAFVAKLDANGASLVYSTYLGGEADDFGFGIALDAAGNAYVTGSTASATFPNNSAVTCIGSRLGPTDAFVAKVNVTGSSLGYCTFVGGTGDDSAAGIAADAAGNVWIAGSTTSTETVVGGPQTRPGGGTDAFVAMLDTAGALVYQTYLGGAGEDHATAIAVDNLGSAYVTGSTTSTNFPMQAPLQSRFGGSTDAFVTKLTPAGDAFVFSTYLGGTGADVGNGIAVNPVDGTVTVVGSTASTDFPTRSAAQGRLAGGLDVFASKLEAAGDAFVYSTYLGGTGNDVALAVAVDANGVAYLTGTTNSSTFPVSPGQILNGGIDAFVTQIGDGGIIQFSANNYTISEDGGSATISVQRTGDLSAQVTVDYVTSDGTATADADYLATSGTLTFVPGQIIATFSVSLLDDTIGDGDETVNLTLRNPTGGAVLGVRRTATLTIVDNEPAINFSASTYTVQENKGPAVVTVTRSGPTTGTVTARVTTSDGTATAPADYSAVNTTVTFAPGVKSVNVSVPIVNDTLAEGTQTINLTLSNVSGGTPPAVLGVRSSATINIMDDDLGGTVQFGKPLFTVTEPTTGTVLATITVTRAAGAASNVTVDYAISDGLPPTGASNGKNYVATSGTLTFGASETSKTFTVTVRSDGAATGDLFALLTLSNPTGGAVLGSFPTAALKIVDSAPRFSFSTDSFTVKEGTPTATITVIRTGPATVAATVDYTTTDGSATAGVDYQAAAGTLSFPAGTTSKTFTVPILNNTTATGSRTVFLTLGNPTPPSMSIVPPAQATLTITDDDTGGAIEFAGPAFVVAQSAGPATVTLTRSGGLAGGATVNFATSDGTAVNGTDYTATSGTITFGPGETTKTFPVTILVPPAAAGVRTVNLALSTPGGGATIGVRSTAVLRIVDSLSIAFSSPTYSVMEGGTATVTVELTGVNLATVTVDYAASDGSAKQPADYKASAGTLTFLAGGTATSVRTRTFTVQSLQNTLADGTKTVNLTLSNATGGATLVTVPVNRSTAVLSIIDDDQAGSVQFDAATFATNEGAGTATIRVRRTMGTASGVTVDYATTDGTATAGTRYLPAAGRLTFGLGETVKTFTVPLIDDAIAQGPQTVNLTLSNPGGGAALGSQSTAVLTIDDNEPYISLSAGAYTVAEAGGSLKVLVQRGGDLTGTVSIDYATQDLPVAPNAAVAGVDYLPTSGTLTFPPTVTTLFFNVPIVDNSLPQPDRNFVIVLSNPAPAGVGLIGPASAVATIKDDDIGGVIQLSAPIYSVKEDGGEVILTLTRIAGRAGGVSVRLVTGDSPAFVLPPGGVPQTASAGSDYTSTDVRVTFGPGDATKTVRIPILTDAVAEGNETFYVQLSDPQPIAVAKPPQLGAQTLSTVTIVDAQPTVQLPAANFNATEGQPVATVTIQRTAPIGRLSVDFATSDGTATSPADYRSTAGTVVFEAGVTSQSFTVPLVDNQAIEVDKQFTVTLSNLQFLTPSAAGTTLGPRLSATVTIKENDRGGTFVVTGGTIQEGAQNQNSTFLATVSRVGGSGGPVLVRFTADECGIFGSTCKFPAQRIVDFDPIDMDLTFLPGELSKRVPIVIHGNDIPEGSRAFQLTVSNGRPNVMQDGAQIGPLPQIGQPPAEAFVNIVEDDLYFVFLSSEKYQAPESAGQVIVPVIRSGQATRIAQPLAVDMIAVAAFGAVAGQDYVSLGVFDGQSALNPAMAGRCGGLAGADVVSRQTVVFAANQTQTTFRVPFLDDTLIDGPKPFIICINDAQGTGTTGGPGIAFPAAADLVVADDDNGGIIEFASSTYVFPETAPQAIITLVRTGNPNFASNATVVAQTGDLFAPTTPPQSGAAGVDYTSTSITVGFAAGEVTTSFMIPLINDGVADGGKTVNLRIVNPQPIGFPSSPTLGTRQTAVLHITDAAQSINFALANYDVSEGAGQANILVERGGDISAPLTVDFTTADNTAVAGVDYQAVATTVTFPAGSGSVLVPVPIIDNNVVAPDKVVNLTLTNPGAGAALVAGRDTATLTIKDDDVGGVIGFAAGTFTTPEPPGPPGTTTQATVTIVRTGGTAGCPLPLGPPPSCPDATLVTFATSDGTATAGADYTAVTTTVEFGAGESVKTVMVPILSDGVVEGTETVMLTLSSPQPSGPAVMGRAPTLGVSTATLQITETEIRVGAIAYAYSENNGQATLTLVRKGDMSGTVTVDFATVDGAAVSTGDYTATSGTITFAPLESVKTLNVTLVDDALFEGDESFEVVFSNPVGTTIAGDSCGAVTPAPPALVATCTIDVVIIDDDAGGVIEFNKDTFDVVESAGTATITLKRTVGGAGCPLPLTVPTPPGGSCPGATTVTFSTADGTAVDGTDYTATTTTVEFGANEVTKTVTVPVLNTTTGVVTANLFLTNATGGAAIGNQDSAKLRIIDVNDSVGFTALGYTINESGVNAAIGVQRTGLAGSVVVSYLTSPGTATPGSDYTAVTGALTLPAATLAAPITTRTILVPIINDGAVEPNETFTVRLQGLTPLTAVFDPSGCDPASAPGTCDTTVTIVDDDQGGVISFDSATYQVNETAGTASILLRRTGGLGGPVSVTFTTSDGTAVAGTDYGTLGSAVPPSSTVTFAAGQTAVVATVPIINNLTVDAAGRTVNLAISNPQPAGQPASPVLGAITAATLTINDDEPHLLFATPTFTVVEGAPAAPITVRRIGNPAGAVSVTIATSDGTAVAGTDYGTAGSAVPPSGTLTFLAGETTKTFLVPIIDNVLLDGTRTLNVTLSGAVGAGIDCAGMTVLTCTVPLTIVDDDRAGSIAFDASFYSVKEDAGTVNVIITRTGGKGSGVTVSYAAIDDTAANGTDYTGPTVGAPGSVTFLGNETAKTVSIPIANRAGAQGPRRFLLVLCDFAVCAPGPTAGSTLIPPAQTAVTVLDKDTEQTVQFSAQSYSVSEAAGSATITVQRLGNPLGTLTVDFTSSSGVARTLTFAAGVRSQTVSVPIANNTAVDGNRTITLTLDNLTGAALPGIVCGTGATALTCSVPLLVVDEDLGGVVQFSAATYQVNETAGNAIVTLTRTGGSAGPVSVELALDPPLSNRVGTPTPNPITFGPGVLSKTVTIPILNNTVVDGTVKIVLHLTNPLNGVVLGARDTATLTIVDDDLGGVMQFTQALYTVTEPAAPPATATITVTRSGGAASGVTVDYATSDVAPCPPPAGTSYACAGTNYVATSGTLTFAAGQTSQSFTVTVLNDLAATGSIPLNLTLSNPSGGGTLGARSAATLKIVDIQAAVGFALTSYSVTEGGSAVVTVERTGPVGLPGTVTVHYATSDGTATSVGPTPDYRATSGNLTFNPGVGTLSFSVPTVGDSRQQGNRDFNVTLTPVALGGGTTLVRNTATVTIVDNDVAGALTFSSGAYLSSEFGFVTVGVRRPSIGTAGPVTVNYATVDGTAKAGVDYVAKSGTLTFGPGVTAIDFTVSVLPNTRDDGDRSFTIELSSPTGGATLGTPSTATVLIHNDDVAGIVQWSVVSFSASRTCAVAPCTAALTVKRFNGGASEVTVDYATVDGTGNALHDYLPVTDTVTFNSGETLKTVRIPLRAGATVGSNFGVILSNPQGRATLGTQSTATVTITP
ncbi:MAG TPA: Calx-beta domain-containing protein [Methylomirabilota bacterium]